MLSRYVEEKYKLDIGNAQVTQLSKAITSGADKGVFALPKGKSISDFTTSPQMLTFGIQGLLGGSSSPQRLSLLLTLRLRR